VDGTEVANGTASVPRKVAGAHGFVADVDLTAYETGGVYKINVECMYEAAWFSLGHSPVCVKDSKEVPCS
jgi:hypothetical protein